MTFLRKMNLSMKFIPAILVGTGLQVGGNKPGLPVMEMDQSKLTIRRTTAFTQTLTGYAESGW